MKAGVAPPSYGWDDAECLNQYDITLIVDDSGSMGPQDHDGPGTVSLWTRARAAIVELVTAVVEHNPQGIRIIFLNSKHSKKGVKTAAEVMKLFDTITPGGLTPIGKKLRGILPYQHFWSVKEPKKKKIYFIVSDGVPSDKKVVKEAITRTATGYSKRSESYTTDCEVCGKHSVRKIGIQFIQIGNDKDATAYLVGLDDHLKLPIDIVDTTPTSPVDGHLGGRLIKALLGAVIGYVDRAEFAE
ncbi:hypothetical protein B0H14DRAFT_2972983 [Mycena olivaceomarginata]|nr:hypothetical protein B0H14DRAFT_2972983 [Mycena olivaceomarginata]